MRILAIESSCDETAVAVVSGSKTGITVENTAIASSAEMHIKYGGIIPEIAAREQVRAIIPSISEVFNKTTELVDGVAVTYGPGLMGSLLIGVESAKVLAWSWKKKLYRVNHMKGHVAANWIVEKDGDKVPDFPALALIVSGGHTDLVLMTSFEKMEWVGGTRDDAAGEAFDKAARLLGLPYPGGVEIEKRAKMATKKVNKLPRPMINEDGLEMSFSGLKAALAKEVSANKEDFTNEWAKEFSEAVVEVLTKKVDLAIEKFSPKSLLLCGGVAANKEIRNSLSLLSDKKKVDFFVPDFKYCTDNAAMIGAAAILFPDEVEIGLLKPDPSLPVC